MKQISAIKRRKGMAIIAAIVLMAVLTILLSVVTLQVVAQRNMGVRRQRQFQAEWLARAGVELAASRILENATGFDDDKQSLLPDTKIRIKVTKKEPDLYAVSVDSQVGSPEEQPVVRTLEARFRRAEVRGVVRLQAVPPER